MAGDIGEEVVGLKHGRDAYAGGEEEGRILVAVVENWTEIYNMIGF